MPINQRFALTDAVDLFILDREAQNLAHKTIHTYRARLTNFAVWCNDQGLTLLGDLTSVHIRQYQAQLVKRVADVTAKNRMVDIKTFLKFCVSEGLLPESPAARVKLPRVVERLPQVLTATEVKRLYKAAEIDRDKALFLVMLDTGARCEEMTNMDAEDINMEEGTILIRKGKPRRDRTVYISPKTRKELLRYLREESITILSYRLPGLAPAVETLIHTLALFALLIGAVALVAVVLALTPPALWVGLTVTGAYGWFTYPCKGVRR